MSLSGFGRETSFFWKNKTKHILLKLWFSSSGCVADSPSRLLRNTGHLPWTQEFPFSTELGVESGGTRMGRFPAPRAQSLSCVWHFVTLWTVPSRLLCSQDSPGKNAGVGCHFLLQRICPTQGSNWLSYSSCTGRWILLPLSSLENPLKVTVGQNKYDYKTVDISFFFFFLILFYF